MTYVPPVGDRATPRGVERLVEVARAFHANPNDDDCRLTFLKATFNLDRTAALIVALADGPKDGTADAQPCPGRPYNDQP